MKLKDNKIILDEATRVYIGDDKRYRGITRMIGNQLFPNQYSNVPKYILERAAKRGNRIHADLTMYDVLGTAKSEEVGWYKEVLKKHNLTIHQNEYIVTDGEEFASPIDKVGTIEDEVVLIDVKATYKLNVEYVRWQLSIYKYFFELNNPHLKVGRVFVLHVKDGASLVEVKAISKEIIKELLRCEKNGEKFENPFATKEVEPVKPTRAQSRKEYESRVERIDDFMDNKEIAVIDPQEFGLEEKTAEELTVGLSQILAERELLIKEFEVVSKLEISTDTIPKFKALRNKIVKNRTQGINKWHKTGKEYFLRGGQFLDAIRRREIQVNENMEKVLQDGENFFENIEKERLEKLQAERVEKVSAYIDGADERDFTKFEEDEFEAFLQMKKKEYEEAEKAEKLAEAERLIEEKEKAERLEKLEAENKEFKEKVEKERQKTKELERLLEEKEEAEAKIKADAEAKKEKEASKGDAGKLLDLIKDLEDLKTKYTFSGETGKAIYAEAVKMIDHIIKFIEKNKNQE